MKKRRRRNGGRREHKQWSYDLSDNEAIERLAMKAHRASGRVTVPSDLVYCLAYELLRARADLARLKMCETADEMVIYELDEMTPAVTLAAELARRFARENEDPN